MEAHYDTVMPILKEFVSGPATLDSFELHGSEKELKWARPIVRKLKLVTKEAPILEYSRELGKVRPLMKADNDKKQPAANPGGKKTVLQTSMQPPAGH